MRFTIPILILFFLSACGSTPVENPDKTDSVENVPQMDTTVYSLMSQTTKEITLPALIESDEMQKLPGLKIDAQSGYDLLPGEFEPQLYNSVYCIARSVVNAETDALWFCLKSPGEYEEAPETVDIMMVLYDKSGKPLDACMIASQALGYSYSYVRADSIFTIEVEEMEDINITTYGVEIRRDGFMPEGAVTTTFKPTGQGMQDAEKISW